MEQLTWLFFGAFAMTATGVGLFAPIEKEFAGIFVGAAALLWAYWGFNATNITIVTDAGLISQEYVGAMYFGLALSLILGLFTFAVVMETLGVTESDSYAG